MDMRFGTLNAMSLCREGSMKAVAYKLAKYKLDFVEAQEVR
jgi:hypothetical protein